jgi:hypothetical protein
MVYYGVVSKGCQRCRQRKVKARYIPNPSIRPDNNDPTNCSISGTCESQDV